MARKAPCPYCYYEINPAEPSYRCAGRPAPGRTACVKAEDPVRTKELNDATPVYPSFEPSRGALQRARRTSPECPYCFGPTGIRVCSVCHSVLPVSFGSDSPLIGIVGVKGSGKTVLLTVLSQELRTNVASRFDAAITDVGSSRLLGKLRGYRQTMDNGGQLPEPTPKYVEGELVPAVLEWRYARAQHGLRRERATVISFYDPSGEDLETSDQALDQHYLAATSALIFLVDPFGFPTNRAKALERDVPEQRLSVTPLQVLQSVTDLLRSTEHLRASKLIKRPLAVVVTKIDAFYEGLPAESPIRRTAPQRPSFDEGDSLDQHHHVEGLIHVWGGDEFLTVLRHNFKTWRLFAASALGAEPDYRTGTANSRGVLPHRVAEPLLWLMAGQGFVPKVGP